MWLIVGLHTTLRKEWIKIMNNLAHLEKYFYSSIAESEKDILKDVFVTSSDFFEIIKPKSATVRILVGNKGSGKSALLEFLLQKSREQNIPAIKITPSELFDLDFEEKISPARIIYQIRNSIIRSMAIEAGKNLSGLLNENENRLFRDAINAGATQESITDKALTVLAPIGKALTNIDFEKMLPNQNITETSRKRDIEQYLNGKKVFYLLLDDIDQIRSVSRSDYYDVIWGEILAVLRIAQDLPNVYPIISVRKEIWRKLCVDNGNRDKYDQIRNMVYSLYPSRNELRLILDQRLRTCIEKYNIIEDSIYAPFFFGTDCKLPSSNERRLWPDYLVSASRENPRDVIQLVYLLIKSAHDNSRPLINETDVQDTSLNYSKECVHDVTTQNTDICDNLEAVIRSFVKIEFRSPADIVRRHLLGVPGQCDIRILEKHLKPNQIEDAFLLWSMLYNIGFINPRMPDNTQKKNFSFIPYDETLVSIARWNDMQKYEWEVHPCYRSFLIDIKNQNMKRAIWDVDSNSSRTNSHQNKHKKNGI